MTTANKFTTELKPLMETLVPPRSTRMVDSGTLLIDFGQAVFGTLMFAPPPGMRSVVVHLGEKLDAHGRIDREPGATIRYRRIEQPVPAGPDACRLVIPPDERNTGPAAIRMPPEIREVMPFRYAEIEGGAKIDPDSIRQVFVHYPFDDTAARFECSYPTLNQVWELCKHMIKATTFYGVYIDGDRERDNHEMRPPSARGAAFTVRVQAPDCSAPARAAGTRSRHRSHSGRCRWFAATSF